MDDRPYGGGPGMVMMPEPLEKALESIETRGRMLLMAPSGRPFDQQFARELAQERAVTLICGRYEGIDARLALRYPIEAVSVGDFVLGGGEAAALCVLEAVGRLLEGFMGHADSGERRRAFPADCWNTPTIPGRKNTMACVCPRSCAPEITAASPHGGGSKACGSRSKAVRNCCRRRRFRMKTSAHCAPCGENGAGLRLGRNLYVALTHYPVLDRRKKVAAVSLTNLDLHDIARCSRAYDLGGSFIVTPLEDQRALAAELLGHWTSGPGKEANPERGQALERMLVVPLLEDAIASIRAATGKSPLVVATSATMQGSLLPSQVRSWLRGQPVLLVLGTSHGLAPQVIQAAHGVLRPIRPMNAYNHLPVRAAAAICCDRILGDCW